MGDTVAAHRPGDPNVAAAVADRTGRGRCGVRALPENLAAGWRLIMYALRVFADFYFTRVALLLAVIGYGLLVSRLFWRAPALLLTISALGGFFFYKMRIWPEHFWLARRFLTEILPGALICATATIFAPMWYWRTGVRQCNQRHACNPSSRQSALLSRF